MKTNKLYKLSALIIGALLLGACAKRAPGDELENGGGRGPALNFTVRVATDPSLRALNQDELGTESEKKVEQGFVFFKEHSNIQMPLIKQSEGVWKSDLLVVETNGQTNLQMTLLLNNPIDRLRRPDFTKDRRVELKDLLTFAGINGKGMLMSGTVGEADNIRPIDVTASKEEVMAGSKNNYSFTVERLVAKLQMTKVANLPTELPNIGKLKPELTYSMAGSAKESYLFRDRAGKRELADFSPNVYTGFTSIIDAKKVPANWDPEKEHPFLQRVSDKEGDEYILGGYYSTAKEVKEYMAQPTSLDGGFYFFENSMYGGAKKSASERGEIRYNRIAYAKVYAQMDKFTNVYVYDKETRTRKLSDDPDICNKKRVYEVDVPWEIAHKIGNRPPFNTSLKLRYSTSYTDLYGNRGYFYAVYYDVEDEPGTFYVGVTDGFIYATLKDAQLSGNFYVRRYTQGKMVYLVPINEQKDATKGFVNYCDTRRNNIYDLRINSIKGLGLNYDPVDPADPNIPYPNDNPLEPPIDAQKPVEERIHQIRLKANILQWNEVVRHVNVGDGGVKNEN